MELYNVQKYYGDRLIFSIKELRIYQGDKIGVVGLNGSGKTTLLDVMAGRIRPDGGVARIHADCAYITQDETGGEGRQAPVDPKLAGEFNVTGPYREYRSGGEKTRYKILRALGKKAPVLLADEPTANLDLAGIGLLENKLAGHKGALVLVSHDRELLDKVCNKILEIDRGRVKLYQGDYSSYYRQKVKEERRKEFEYEQYVRDRKILLGAIQDRKQRAVSLRKTPQRMGNSEARLHKMGNQKAKANLDKAVKAMESRLEKLEVKEKPETSGRIKLDILASGDMHSKVLIEGENINKGFGPRVLFDRAGFHIYNGQKTAVIGENGCGKTTLLKMIMGKDEGIRVAPRIKFGYLSQDMGALGGEGTVLESILAESIYDEAFVRTILGRLLIKRDDVYKRVKVLSGGERVRVALARIILSDVNLIILDEPTNYLDIYSMEALENTLSLYRGNLLFVSHDRKFINSVATHLLVIENAKIEMFKGNYAEYLQSKESSGNQADQTGEQKMVLENRLSEILGRLSSPGKGDDVERLDREYKEIILRLRALAPDKRG